MNWYLSAVKKYAVFSGRARRKEYWYFMLFYVIGAVILGFIDGLLGTFDVDSGMGTISSIYVLALIIPSIAVAVRRLHDTGRKGWWLLLYFVPFIGAIVLIIFCVQKSSEGENEYGPNPIDELS